MNRAAAALMSMFGGAVARLKPGAYVPVNDTLPPLAWAPINPGGYPFDLDSSQRFVRPYPLTQAMPHPAMGYSTRPFRGLAPTVRIWNVSDNAYVRLPSGPAAGDAAGATVLGGMGWGPQDLNGMVALNGS